MSSYLVINDKTDEIVSVHATEEEAIKNLEAQGYEHHSGWTYRNALTRDYMHVSEKSQYEQDCAIVKAAEAAGMTVDAYLQCSIWV